MIYAVNDKTSCYTGFWHLKIPGKTFKYMDFLAAQAMPGPGSIITVIDQSHGPNGPTTYMTLEKDA